MAHKIVQFFIFVIVSSTAFGLICYQCDTSEGKFCRDGNSSSTYANDTVDCKDIFGGSLASMASIQCLQVFATAWDGSEYEARGCVAQVNVSPCISVIKTFFNNVDHLQDLNCYTCVGDKCNVGLKFRDSAWNTTFENSTTTA